MFVLFLVSRIRAQFMRLVYTRLWELRQWSELVAGLIYRTWKAFRHFVTVYRKKTVGRIFTYNFGSKRKACPQLIWQNSKHREAGLKLKSAGFLHDSGISEKLHSQYFSLCIKIVVFVNVSPNYISCLIVSKDLFRNFDRCACCFKSYMNIACESTQNAGCIKCF